MPPTRIHPNMIRFVIRKDGGLVLGKVIPCELNQNTLPFKPDTIYEISEIIGEFLVREVGPSNIQEPNAGYQPNWGLSANEIIEGGQHLYTQREAEELKNPNLAPNLLK